MPQTVFIQITSAGANVGPFDLYSDDDSYTTPFETGIVKATLEAGYTSVLVPDGATIIRVQSDNVVCTNYQDVEISPPITTTTSTTEPSDPATSTLTFSSYINSGGDGEFLFTLSDQIFSTNVLISYAAVNGHTEGSCLTVSETDNLNGVLTIYAGTDQGSQIGVSAISCGLTHYTRELSIIVNGVPRSHGQTLTIGGTLVTIDIPSTCSPYLCL